MQLEQGALQIIGQKKKKSVLRLTREEFSEKEIGKVRPEAEMISERLRDKLTEELISEGDLED